MRITIDGPAGSGKSTVARRLAQALGIAFLDTGATYRAVTLKALREGVDMLNEQVVTELARRANIQLIPEASGSRVLLDGQDVTREIRSPQVTDNVHYVARCGAARQVLVELQRRLGEALGHFVTEGRDQGSVVFPSVPVKFYLDASAEVRARRRHEELLAAGETVCYDDILSAIVQRDQRDQSRRVAPLVKPTGAIVIDTSDKTIDEVTQAMLRCVEAGR